MMSHPKTSRRSSARAFTIHAAAALIAAIVGSGCKASESPKAPEPAAPATPAAETSAAPAPAAEAAAAPSTAPSVYSFNVNRLDGTPASLASYAGQVVLIVNTASKCGYTPQYQGLQELHTKYAGKGFEVLGFPSNDFGGQEPGSAEEISKFCISMYDVNFPMFEKTKVVGEGRSPLYALLSDAYGPPKWNFHKYLVDKRGRPVQAWPSATVPSSPEIASAIDAQLALP
jgi:glutathione peroxidase